MPENTRTALETAELLLRTIVEGSRDDLADLYAEDVVISNAFAPEGIPSEARGNESLRNRMKSFEKLWTYESVDEVTLHQTTDPEVVIAEFRVNGVIASTGKKFSLQFVNVMRIVDGLVVTSRDYGNPLQTAVIVEELERAAA
jgi:uncharacterized protein